MSTSTTCQPASPNHAECIAIWDLSERKDVCRMWHWSARSFWQLINIHGGSQKWNARNNCIVSDSLPHVATLRMRCADDKYPLFCKIDFPSGCRSVTSRNVARNEKLLGTWFNIKFTITATTAVHSASANRGAAHKHTFGRSIIMKICNIFQFMHACDAWLTPAASSTSFN